MPVIATAAVACSSKASDNKQKDASSISSPALPVDVKVVSSESVT